MRMYVTYRDPRDWPGKINRRFFSGKMAARSAAKREVEPYETVIVVERWEVKPGKASLLSALTTGTVEPESTESLEVWSLDSDGRLYSWEGGLADDPDLHVGTAVGQ